MQLFYSSEINETLTTFTFDKEESKHIIKVLRKKEGDILHITNGKGYLFECKINFANEKTCEVSIVKSIYQAPLPYSIHLAVAPTKMNDRYEWFLEKATEIGITEITPIICEHSERKIIKTERMHKIIISALKQSNQFYLPKLNEPISFKDFVKNHNNQNLYIAHCEEGNKIDLKNAINKNEKYTLLIGPEGDFSLEEIHQAIEKGYSPVSLGNTRLRTETAAIVACHTFVICQ